MGRVEVLHSHENCSLEDVLCLKCMVESDSVQTEVAGEGGERGEVVVVACVELVDGVLGEMPGGPGISRHSCQQFGRAGVDVTVMGVEVVDECLG